MSEEFNVHFPSEREADAAERQLQGLKAAGTALMNISRTNHTLTVGCRIRSRPPADTAITGDNLGEPVSFFDCFYEIDATKSARHHPDGLLWIRTPDRRHVFQEAKVSLRSIAPTVLRMLNISVPPSMTADPLLEKSGVPVAAGRALTIDKSGASEYASASTQ
jgi:hypothetical protein